MSAQTIIEHLDAIENVSTQQKVCAVYTYYLVSFIWFFLRSPLSTSISQKDAPFMMTATDIENKWITVDELEIDLPDKILS